MDVVPCTCTYDCEYIQLPDVQNLTDEEFIRYVALRGEPLVYLMCIFLPTLGMKSTALNSPVMRAVQ